MTQTIVSLQLMVEKYLIGVCIMYAVDQTYNPTNNGKAWFSDSGTQTPNLEPRVVPVGPDSLYPETKSFGCNGCDRLRALACPGMQIYQLYGKNLRANYNR